MSRHGSNSNTDPKTLSLILILMGCVMIFGAAAASFSLNEFGRLKKQCTESTEGVVQDVREELRTKRRKKRTRTYYVYITDYTYEADGFAYNASSTLSKSEQLDIGDALQVFYDPDDPSVCYTPYDDPGTSSVVGAIVTAALGAVFLAAGIMVRRRVALGGTASGGGLDGAAADGIFESEAKNEDITRLS